VVDCLPAENKNVKDFAYSSLYTLK